jgi:hypothetical protein
MNVELVIEFLKEHGRYRPSPEPVHILDIDFHFDGVLLGPDDHNGLVLVHAVTGNSFSAVSKKLRAFTLALERTASMRTVTLALVGRAPDPDTFAELSRFCRVLVVADESSLVESLASILPLSLPQPLSASDTADAALKAELGDSFSEPFISRLIKAARESEEQVQKTVRSVVDEIAQPRKS